MGIGGYQIMMDELTIGEFFDLYLSFGFDWLPPELYKW